MNLGTAAAAVVEFDAVVVESVALTAEAVVWKAVRSRAVQDLPWQLMFCWVGAAGL